MKVLIVAHTNDEHGEHFPGDNIDLSDGEAQAYAEKNWGIVLPTKRRGIETSESHLNERENAMIAAGDSVTDDTAAVQAAVEHEEAEEEEDDPDNPGAKRKVKRVRRKRK